MYVISSKHRLTIYRLFLRTTFDVIVERAIIAHYDDFLDAFVVLIACYYVFNVAYPKKNWTVSSKSSLVTLISFLWQYFSQISTFPLQ